MTLLMKSRTRAKAWLHENNDMRKNLEGISDREVPPQPAPSFVAGLILHGRM